MRYGLIALLFTGVSYVSMGADQTGSQSPPEHSAKTFAEAKAQHLARLEQELACVEAAATFDAMRACMPLPPGGHMGPPPPDQQR